MSVQDPPARAALLPHPVWLLNLAVMGGMAALFLGPVHALAPLARPHLPAWLIAVAFASAELCVVHLHFRRGAHSFSLGDIPLVFGLLFCGGQGLVLGCLIGTAVVLRMGRRLPPIKFLFNLGQFGLGTCLAALIAHALAPAGHPGSPLTWLAVILATQVAGVVAVLLIACAIYLSERQMDVRTLARMLFSDGAVTLNNTSLGLCAAVMAALDPLVLPLLAVPLGTLFFAYRAYVSELERQRELELVHETGRALAGARQVEGALQTLLERSLEAFRADSAELVLFGAEDAGARRMALGPGEAREALAPLDPAAAEHVMAAVAQASGARLLGHGGEDPELAEVLARRPVRQLLIAPLRGDQQLTGAILLASGTATVGGFDRDDVRLLETLAAGASAALQYDRLESTMQELSAAHEHLHHVASHDPLTQLANRAAFVRRLEEALAADPLAIALLFVDLDNFKSVNDTLGHAAGDELLVMVAERLRACVRDHDLVARLGGDEFAVMVRSPGNIELAAVSVAGRIVRSCEIRMGDEAAAIPVRASVGVAVCPAADTTGAELIHAADVAMYEAKQAGKGRYSVFEPGSSEPAAASR